MSLIFENVSVIHNGRQVVSDASIEVEPGTVAAVLGANGAGKSELVLAAAGMLPVSSGSITVDGLRIDNHQPDAVRRAGVAAVPEGHCVLTELTVEDNLRVAGSVLEARDVDRVLDDAYALFPELAERKHQIAGTMSGGQQQMLAIGHALMARPHYLLIDEMSLGLAPLIVKRLVVAITALVEKGVGVLLVEQFTEVALSIANTVTVMRNGNVHYSGPAQNVKDNSEILVGAYF